MKQPATLQRRQPLRSKAPLKRAPIKRADPHVVKPKPKRAVKARFPGDPVQPEKRKTLSELAEFSPAVKRAASQRSGGSCEARTPVCTGKATIYHHIQLRRGGDGSLSNCLHVCGHCHNHIHHNVAESLALGLLRKVNKAG